MIPSPEDPAARGPALLEHDFLSEALGLSRFLFLVLDRDGNILRVNATFENLLGYGQAEVQGRPVWEWIARPQEAELIREAFAQLAAGQDFPAAYVDHWKSRQGTERLLEWSNVLLRDPHGLPEYVVAIGLDLTERARAQAILQESPTGQRLLLEQVPAVLWTTDRELNFTTGTGAGLAHLGLKPGQLGMVGLSLYTYFHTNDPDHPNIAPHRRALDGENVTFESSWLGRTFHSLVEPLRDSAGRVIGTVGIALDITERRLAEQSLRESEERLELALKASNIGLWTWTIPTNEVYFSDRWKAQLGYEDWEIPNRFEEWENRLHPDDRERVLAHLQGYLSQPRGDHEVECQMRHKDGSYRWIYTRADLTLDDQGRPFRMMGCHVDITERKRAEEALRDRETFLRLAQHAGRIGSFELDLASGRVRWSDEMFPIYGIVQDEFDGTLEGALTFIPAEEQARARQLLQSMIDTGTAEDVEYRIVRPDGQCRELWSRNEVVRDRAGKPLRLFGIVMDVTERKETDSALWRSQANLEAAFALARLGSWELDLNSGQGLWSRQLYHIHGRDEAQGAPKLAEFIELIHPDDRPMIMAAHQRALGQEGTFTVDYRTNPARGPLRHLACTLQRFGPGKVGGIVQDITTRKQVEQALRDSEERYRLIVQNMTEFIVRWLPDGTRTFVNDNYCRYFGLPRAEAVGSSFFDLVATEHRQLILDKIAGLSPDQPVAVDEHKVILPNGEVRWNQWIERGIFDARGVLIELQAVGQDITDRKRAEEALAASERRFRGLIENSADAIMLVDGGALINYVSPAVSRILGWRADELLGRDAFELLHADEIPPQRELLGRLLQGHSPQQTVLRVRHQDGSWRWLEAVGSNRLADPAIQALVINCRDITERRRLEETLRQVQKMEALGRLAGGLAHDFNNLLTVINGHADVLLGELDLSVPWRDSIEEIFKAGHRAAELTRQLLAFSRHQFLQPRVIDLNRVVADIEKMLRRLLGEDIQLAVDLDRAPCTVKADPGQIEQVIVNLVANARDAMPRGGRLVIRSSQCNLDRPPGQVVDSFTPGAYVMLEVSDTGQGIDSAVLPRIFEPFFTTKAVGQGTGLGLATVYGIVQQSGGFLDVASEPGQGTRFSIYLPAVAEPVDTTPTTTVHTDLVRGDETILLIEDQEEVRHIASRVLEQAGYTVLAAASARDAQAVNGRHAGPIHLILSDVIMPEQSGPDAIEQLLRSRPNARVLFMSGFMDHALLGRLAENTPLLPKPFTPVALTTKVREVLDSIR